MKTLDILVDLAIDTKTNLNRRAKFKKIEISDSGYLELTYIEQQLDLEGGVNKSTPKKITVGTKDPMNTNILEETPEVEKFKTDIEAKLKAFVKSVVPETV